MTILSLDSLFKIYRGRTVVSSVSLTVESGVVTGLLGPNGAGKTTTFYMAVGMVRPDRGNVFLDDEDITDYPMYLRARKGIGYLPQETSVFKKLTVKQNVMTILETAPFNSADPVSGKKRILPKSEQEERARMLLEELGVSHLSEQKAGVLSGGERRRVEISRALATEPSFILLDEPFAGVDPLAVADIKNIIGHLKKRGIGVLISDHNVRETLGACDTAYIMSQGKVIESGPPEKIAASRTARQFYLGEEFSL